MSGARRGWQLLLLLTVLALPGFLCLQTARAQTQASPLFLLRIDPCVRVQAEAVAQYVEIELLSERDHIPTNAIPLRPEVSCRGEQVLLEAHISPKGQVLARIVDLNLLPGEVRERILALSLAELFIVSTNGNEGGYDEGAYVPNAQVSQGEPARVAPVQRTPGVEQASSSQFQVPALRLMALFSGQVLLNSPRFLWGGGLGVGWDSPRHIGLTFDLLARHGNVSVDLGAITVDTLSLGAGLSFWQSWSHLRLRMGAGLRGGLVRFAGEPTDPVVTQGATFLGGWLGPALTLGVTLGLGKRVGLEVATEGGYVLVPVTGQVNGMPAAVIAGPFWGLLLGVAFFP
jgi:hypothetical protein